MTSAVTRLLKKVERDLNDHVFRLSDSTRTRANRANTFVLRQAHDLSHYPPLFEVPDVAVDLIWRYLGLTFGNRRFIEHPYHPFLGDSDSDSDSDSESVLIMWENKTRAFYRRRRQVP